MRINLSVMEDDLGSADAVREYLNGLQTRQVMFLNGPESPGPCMRCLQYHRTVWNLSDVRRPQPPLHPNCYCRVVSYRETPGDRPLDKGSHLQRVIRNLKAGSRQAMMGKGIARLHRLGIVETGDLVSQSQGIVTLEQHLQRTLGITEKQFNSLSDGDLVRIFNARQK